MPLPGRRALVAALACALAGPLAALDAASGQPGTSRLAATGDHGPSLNELDARGSTATGGRDRLGIGAPTFVGIDGLLYDIAPMVVGGAADELFLGQDFDVACGDGKAFAAGIRRLGKLAKLIEASGRRAVFTVAPNKSSVDGENVQWSTVPHGACTQFGVADQNATLDTISDERYLPLRKLLASDARTVYWKTDAHWTTVGSSVYAAQLARHLSTKLARQQRYSQTMRTELGDLYQLLGRTDMETAPALLPANGVTVNTRPGSAGFDPVNAVTFEHSWSSSPRRKTLRGRAAVIGDSFTYLGLESLRPLFARGTFVWIQPTTMSRIVEVVAASDTVVIEVVQRFVSTSILGTRAFRSQLRTALRKADR